MNKISLKENKNKDGKTMETEENKNKDGKTMETEENKNKDGKTMEKNEQATVTKEQKKEYQNCLKIFEKSTKAWVEIAEAYNCLRKLPKELWMGDDVMQNEKCPNVGKFLKAKYDISQGRLSQISGAYDARQQLAQANIKGYETISCDALYEIFRFVKGKDNEKEMTVKDVYESVRAVGAVNENTVKEWRKQFKTTVVKQYGAVFERLSKVIEEARKTNLKAATKEIIDMLKTQCRDLLDMIEKAENTEYDYESKNNREEEKQKETESKTMANVA